MRIVSLSPAVTDALVELGAGDELVGVSVYCRPYAPSHAEVVGDYLNVKADRLRELNPTLVFTSGPAQEALARRLSSLGFRVAHLPLPTSLYEVAGLVWRVGVIVGRVHEALEKSRELVEKFVALRGSAPPERILYVIDLGEPVSPAGLSYAGHALTHIGVRHAYEAIPEAWVRVLPGDVRRYRPSIIVFEARVEKPDEKLAVQTLSRWMLVDEKLLAKTRIVAVPRDTLAHYGPRLAERLAKLAEAIAAGGAAHKRTF